ncbi:MAG: site-2 protease family protein [Gemmatimonadota bacterium]
MENVVYILPILLFSVVVHEYAHGYVANLWGDPTAAVLGRLTLNPIPHIDPIGSILVPALLLLSPGGFLFGWAKPVPVNPDNFRDKRWGDVTVSLAGPASNLLLSFLFAAVWVIARMLLGIDPVVERLFYWAILLNLILAFFNLLPIPPLDGSHVLANFLPRRMAYRYMALARYGFLILILVLVLPGFREIVWRIVLPPVQLVGGFLVGLVNLLA